MRDVNIDVDILHGTQRFIKSGLSDIEIVVFFVIKNHGFSNQWIVDLSSLVYGKLDLDGKLDQLTTLTLFLNAPRKNGIVGWLFAADSDYLKPSQTFSCILITHVR